MTCRANNRSMASAAGLTSVYGTNPTNRTGLMKSVIRGRPEVVAAPSK